jgi:ADP-ribosylglycohydrolase
MVTEASRDQAMLSLEGLSVGDAFGELLLRRYPRFNWQSDIPPGPWEWTDDTHMALSVVEVMCKMGRIDQDALAQAFAVRFADDPDRGYAVGASKLLGRIAEGRDWRVVSPKLFVGGSYGNGAAMRAAPIGGYFSGDHERAAKEAQLSAEVTHAHPEGQAGAIAVAVAASIASQREPSAKKDLLDQVLEFVPQSITSQGIATAQGIADDQLTDAIRLLGTGQKVSAQDTVPFCLWVAANFPDDFELALRTTLQGMGDCDTTCAIVGGIVALSAKRVPQVFLDRREPLPRIECHN